MEIRLDGRTALITGGSRGLGRAMAETFAAAGASVCVVAREQGPIDETIAACGDANRALPYDTSNGLISAGDITMRGGGGVNQ